MKNSTTASIVTVLVIGCLLYTKGFDQKKEEESLWEQCYWEGYEEAREGVGKNSISHGPDIDGTKSELKIAWEAYRTGWSDFKGGRPYNSEINAVRVFKEEPKLNVSNSLEPTSKSKDLTNRKPQKESLASEPSSNARAPTQSEMTEEAVTNYEELDEIHQAIYDEILLIYQDDKEFIEYLRKSQRAWIKFRDAHILMTWPALETKSRRLGTAERMSVPNHLATLTQARIDELLKWRRGLEEGFVDAGTIKLVEEIKAKEKQLDLKAR